MRLARSATRFGALGTRRAYRAAAADYRACHHESLHSPESFWLNAAGRLEWMSAPAVALDRSRAPLYQWFPDGLLNTCHNALDRHLAARAGQTAIAYHSAVGGPSRSISYAELHGQVSRFAGALSELASSVVVVPQEVIKSRMQLGANPSVSTGGWLTTQSNYRNAVHAIVSIVREEGVRGLYAGFRACVAVDCTFGAIQFVLYEHFKSLHRLRTGRLPTDELSTAEALCAGAAAGGLAGLATNPLDVVAARLMVQGGGEGGGERGVKVAGEAAGGNRGAAVRYTGALHCYRETVRREGARALWNGAVPRVLSIAPVVAVQFAVYEAIKGWLGVDEDFDFDDQ